METFFHVHRRRTDGMRQKYFRDAYAASRCCDDRSTPERITWCYGEWKEAYATMDLVDVRFEEGLPSASMFDSSTRNLIVIDDLMAETTLFTKKSNHRNTSVLSLVQNLLDSLFIPIMSELVKRHIVCIQALNRIKSNKLKRAIIANADADLLCALAECAYNILKKNIPLSELQRRSLSKYRTKLRELAQRRTPAARKRRILLQQQVGEGQSGGFLSAFQAPLASSVFLPLLREVLLKR